MSSGTAGNPACLRQTQCYDSWSWGQLIKLASADTICLRQLSFRSVIYSGEISVGSLCRFIPLRLWKLVLQHLCPIWNQRLNCVWFPSTAAAPTSVQEPNITAVSWLKGCWGWLWGHYCFQSTHPLTLLKSGTVTVSKRQSDTSLREVRGALVFMCVAVYTCVSIFRCLWLSGYVKLTQTDLDHLNTHCLNFSHGSSDTSRFDASYTFTVSPWLAKMTLVICLMIAWSWILNQLSKKVKTFLQKRHVGNKSGAHMPTFTD